MKNFLKKLFSNGFYLRECFDQNDGWHDLGRYFFDAVVISEKSISDMISNKKFITNAQRNIN